MTAYAHLSLAESEAIAVLRTTGLSLREIGLRLGRVASTISRERRRNALPKGGDQPVHAGGWYRARRQRMALLERAQRLRRFVRQRRPETWTPEPIAGWLERGEERQLRPLGAETIRAFVHRPAQQAEQLWRLLPRGRARRGRRRARRPRTRIAERASIHDRPPAVDDRREAGHWAGDLLLCKRTRPVLVLKERKTRFVLAARLPRGLDLDALADAELQEIVLAHNVTPRQCLGFLTPIQALLMDLGKDVRIRFAQPRCASPWNPPSGYNRLRFGTRGPAPRPAGHARRADASIRTGRLWLRPTVGSDRPPDLSIGARCGHALAGTTAVLSATSGLYRIGAGPGSAGSPNPLTSARGRAEPDLLSCG